MGADVPSSFRAVKINPDRSWTPATPLMRLLPASLTWPLLTPKFPTFTAKIRPGVTPLTGVMNSLRTHFWTMLGQQNRLLGAIALFFCPDLSSVHDFYADPFLYFRLYAGQWQP